MKWGLKGGISIDTDSGPHGYVLWCCGSRSQDFFTFIQIGSGHTVRYCVKILEVYAHPSSTIKMQRLVYIFSVYFLLFPYPNNSLFFGYSLSFWSNQLEQFFFLTLEHFFFQYRLLQFLLESFQVEVLIRQSFVVFNKNRSWESWKTSLAGDRTRVLPIWRWTHYQWADDPIDVCQ